MSLSFTGQTVLVTGASSGIGRAIAIAFGTAGANVCINFYNDQKGAEETRDVILRANGTALIVHADISKEDEVQAMFESINGKYGLPDILISNAGIQQDSPLAEMTLAQWQKVIDTNLTGHFLCAREAINAFLTRDTKKSSPASGKIIFISSVHDIIPWAGHANYTASKGGLLMLMKSMALEYAPNKIRINCISPGAIRTGINRNAWETKEAESNLLRLIPYGRIGEPEDIARIALWLASDESDYITGTTIYADGGMTLYPGFANGG